MPLVLADRVRDTTTTTGTGTVTLSGTAPSGYQNFSVVGNGNTTYYTINAGSQWEVGIGTYSSTGPTLARTTVLASSNSGSLVDFSAGTKDVFVTYPAGESVYQDGASIAAGTAVLGVANGGTGATTLSSGYLVKGNGTSAVSASVVYDNGTNVGIGTASPSQKLDVAGSINAGTTNGVTLFMADSSAIRNTATAGNTMYFDSGVGTGSTTGDFQFRSTASFTTRLYINGATGSVGVGTTSPARLFEVTATGTNIPARLGNSQGNLDIGGSDGVVVNIDTRSWAMGLQTGGTERMRITTAGLVGIGTSAPASRLDIGSGDLRFSGTGQRILGDFSNATIANRLAIQTTTASSATVIPIIPSAAGLNVGINLETDPTFTSGNVGQIVVVAGQEFRINSGNRGAGAYLPMTFYTNGSERMRITTAGLVGVGTSAPGYLLHGVQNGNAEFRVSATNVGTNSAGLTVENEGNRNWNLWANRSTDNFIIGANGRANDFLVINGSSGAMTLNVGGVSSTHQFLYNESGGEIQLVDSTGAGPILIDNSGGLARFYKVGSGAISMGTTGANYFQFITSSIERMRIDGSGNVGIGTATPAYTLDLTGTQRISKSGVGYEAAMLRFETLSETGAIYRLGMATGGSFAIGRADTSTTNITLDSSGNVGIGTSSPSSRLTVQGDELIIPAAGWTSGQAARLYLGDTNNGVQSVNGSYQTYFAFNGHSWNINGSEAMRIDGSRNVGIGTSSPSARLDVTAGSSPYIAINTTNGANKRTGIRFNQNGTAQYDMGVDIGVSNDRNFYLYDSVAAVTRLYVSSGGNVGIGNISPDCSLQVTGGIRARGGAPGANGVNNNGFGFSGGGGDVDGGMYSSADGQVEFYTNAIERMRITSVGNVGIGTSSPATTLDVNGVTTLRNSVNLTAGAIFAANGEGLWMNGFASYGAGITSDAAGTAIRLWTSGTERMRIDSSGNVGIGTSSPGAKLQINAQDGFRFDVEAGAASTMRFGSASTGEATAALAFTRTTGVISLSSGSTGSALNERMRIDGSGNVAIGTTTTASRLRVAAGAQINAPVLGNVTNYPAFLSGPDTGFGLGIGTNNADGRTWLQSQRSDGGTATYPITLNEAGGNVGIGTSAPGSKLTVVGGAVQQYKASGDNNAFYGSTSDTSNNYLRLQNSVNTVDVTCSNGSAYLNSAQSVLWFGNNGVERMRLSGSELLVGTTSGGRSLCLFGSDVWQRIHNASRSWLIGMGTGSGFIIYDETSGQSRFVVDTNGNWNGQNSISLGAGQNLDNKIEIGAGRTGNNYAYIDLIGDTTYTDYGLRIIRNNSGPNTSSQIAHRGTEGLFFTAVDAAPLFFQTNNATRAYFQSDGTMVMNGALLVGRNTTGSNVNTNNDTGSFSVRGDASNAASMSFHRIGAFAINMGLGTDAVFRIGGWSASSNCFQMDASGNLTMLGNVTAYSDARIKKDVETIGSALDLVSKMRGVRYTRIDSGKRGVGVIAQEMLEVLPEVVQQGVGDDDTLSVAYGNLVGVLIEAIKELRAEIVELKGK